MVILTRSMSRNHLEKLVGATISTDVWKILEFEWRFDSKENVAFEKERFDWRFEFEDNVIYDSEEEFGWELHSERFADAEEDVESETAKAADARERVATEEQQEYDEDESYDGEDEVHNGEDEARDGEDDRSKLRSEFECLNLEPEGSAETDNMVLLFNEGVEVRMPNDDAENAAAIREEHKAAGNSEGERFANALATKAKEKAGKEARELKLETMGPNLVVAGS